MGKIFPH